MSERDLTGRCGTCGFFVFLRRDDEGRASGDCRLGCWPSPLKDTMTCSRHKPLGQSFVGSLARKKVAGEPTRRGPRGSGGGQDDNSYEPERRPTIPQEIGIDMDQAEFKQVLREVLLEELGVRDVSLGDRWRGGEVELKPGREGVQSKSVPIDVFFKKIVLVREKLRVLEQKINSSANLADDEKVQLQQYVTACYGSLTTFNVLFADKDDHFTGQSSK
ncbi:MAG: hypothetical protein KC593_24135 [Myxococcales bacterium]|nr:hypothetical protein [Myxococcales bacterium]MCB9626427.1 hypothetical protein [Sandaracinaceae bacterium]